jgi:hypothetical protein
MNDIPELISLAELIEQVKADLLASAPTAPAVFFIDGVEVTAQVLAQRQRMEGGKAGLRLSVLGAKAEAGVDSHTTVAADRIQTVKVHLTPLIDKAEAMTRLAEDERERVRAEAVQAVMRGSRDGGDAV